MTEELKHYIVVNLATLSENVYSFEASFKCRVVGFLSRNSHNFILQDSENPQLSVHVVMKDPSFLSPLVTPQAVQIFGRVCCVPFSKKEGKNVISDCAEDLEEIATWRRIIQATLIQTIMPSLFSPLKKVIKEITSLNL